MKRHKGRQRLTYPRVLILCEGKTEKNYFQAILQEPEYKHELSAVRISVFSGKGSSPEKVVQEAINRRNEAIAEGIPFKEVWLIFDHDNHPNRQKAWNKAILNKLGVAFSAFAFEQWYLLHFIQSTRTFTRYTTLEKELLKYYPTYKKAKQNDFTNLKPYLPKALSNAIWLRGQKKDKESHLTDHNPWTDVDILVQKMISGNF